MLKIGEFSKLAQVSVKALRHYDRLGLLEPAWIDRFTGYRYYRLEQLPRLNRILALKDLGFSLAQVRALLHDDLPAAELRGMLRIKHAELQRQVQAQQARLERVQARLRQIEREGTLSEYEVVLKAVPMQTVIGLRDILPAYERVNELAGQLRVELGRLGLAPEAMRPLLAVYYDAEYRERNIDVEVALRLPSSFGQRVPPSARAVVHNLRGAPAMASAVHQGGYETLGQAYSALSAWTQANGFRVTGPNRELYLQGAESGPDPTHYVTEIQIPVASERSTGPERKRTMEPKIVTKPAFTVMGLRYYGKNEKNEIPALWGQLNTRWHELNHRASEDAYGVCYGEPDDEGEFEYIAGVDVSAEVEVPEGMVCRSVPAARYAVFPCTLQTIHETYEYAAKTWLPQSGHEWARSPDFELYDATFDPEDPESTMYVYIPIR
jgi:predicted transcriptional regulator YdeE/DNA-binding transcriptional MerR regulator